VLQTSSSIDNIVQMLDTNDVTAIERVFSQAHPADIADALEQLTPVKRPLAWLYIPQTSKGQVLAELNDGVFKNLAYELDKDELVEAIKVLELDEIADLIPELPESILADVLFAVDRETRNNLGEVLSYAEDTAGGLMNLDATAVRDNVSLEVVLHYLRRLSELPEHTNTIYLVDRNNCLTGILPIERLITAPAQKHLLTMI